MRKIRDIKPGDKRVRLVGTLVEVKGKELILDDGSARIRVIFEDESRIRGFEVGEVVRIFGKPVKVGNELFIKGELIQDMSALNLELAKKVWEVLFNV